MYNTRIVAISIISILSGCTGSNENTNILGSFASKSCIQLTDNNNLPINAWVKNYYNFMNTGLLSYSSKMYFDSDCIQENTTAVFGGATPVILNDTIVVTTFSPVSYVDNGTMQLQEGISGNKVMFHIDIPPEFIEIVTFYTRVENDICFSNSFAVNEENISFSKIASESINFSNCVNYETP